MMSILGNSISTESFLMVFIPLLIIVYFVYKEWPEFKRRMSGPDTDAKTVDERLARDYVRLNTVEKLARANADAINDSLEERRIIMQALLACLEGLQEVGADGETGAAIKMINEYLNRQAHVNQEVRHDADAPKLNPNI